MFFDQFSMNLALVSLIVGFLTVVIVGSQSPEDARTIAIWTLLVLVPMLLVSCACLVSLPGWRRHEGGPGMVVFSILMILSVHLGHRTAKSREFDPHGEAKGNEGKPAPWDDEFGV
jgi:hypothetical protein